MPRHRSRKIGSFAVRLTFVCLASLTTVSMLSAQNQGSNLNQGGGYNQQVGNPQGGTNQQGYGGQQGSVGQQGPIGQQGGGGAQGAIDQQNLAPRILPCPFPQLSPEHIAYLDQLLGFWEHSSGQIDMFQCKFNRWVYDPVFGPPRDANGELPAKTISSGQIKYKTPDKGLFFVEGIWQYTASGDPQAEPWQPTGLQEQWICDGIHIHEFDYENKQLIKRELPPEMRGKGLSNGPLPFLFGAKKDELNARYWVRVITPQDATGEYWIEAYPKYPADARNYYKVVIILDESDFLPRATEIFDPNYHPQTNPTRTVFEFEERKIFKEGQVNLDIRKLFAPEFFEPKVDRDWKEIFQPYREAAMALPNQEQGVPR